MEPLTYMVISIAYTQRDRIFYTNNSAIFGVLFYLICLLAMPTINTRTVLGEVWEDSASHTFKYVKQGWERMRLQSNFVTVA